jgi:flagellin
MSLVVNTNVSSMNAQRSLMASGRELQTAMERLSSGKKINSAADDAAGFAIAESMTAQIRGLSMAAKNANDGLGMLKVIENATNDVTDILQRVRELAVQAASDTNSASDISNLQLEADSLIAEIDRISSDTTYNGVAYLGSGAKSTDADPINIQVGYNDGDVVSFKTYNISTSGTGTLSGLASFDIDGATALSLVSSAINTVAGYKAAWGAGQNRLEYTVSNLMNVVEFTTAARSRIQDADFAVEAARLAKAQVLQQTGTAMLAQANASPQLAISLLS